MVRLRLKQVLEEKNITMARLSRMTDISYNTVQEMCRVPHYDAKLSTLSKIAEALNIPFFDLLEEYKQESL